MREAMRAVRAEARRLGVPWAWVVALKNELVAAEREVRSRTESISQIASPGRRGRRFTGGRSIGLRRGRIPLKRDAPRKRWTHFRGDAT